MNRWLPAVLLLGVALPGAADPVPPGGRDPRLAAAVPGAKPAEVKRALGEPARVSRQVLYRRYLEQWGYDAPLPVRVEWEFAHGQEPRFLGASPTR